MIAYYIIITILTIFALSNFLGWFMSDKVQETSFWGLIISSNIFISIAFIIYCLKEIVN